MIKIHELAGDKGARQSRKRVGRGEGSGQGRTAGKGNKGGQARAGAAKGKGFEGGQTPLARRVPKRGFSTDPWRLKSDVINLMQLAAFDENSRVDVQALSDKRLVSKNVQRVKILGEGAISRKLTVVAHAFSATARQKIEAAGGSCELIEAKKEESESKE